MQKKKPQRIYCEGFVPFHRIAGTAFDCGLMLGELWYSQLQHLAEKPGENVVSILGTPLVVKLLEQYAPNLIDLHRGMAKGAGIPEDRLTSIYPGNMKQEECTSFALQQPVTLDGDLISGQTKDTPKDRIFRYQVISVKIKDGLEMLTLTYPGWIFGHGFAAGGCSVFRNSLSCGNSKGKLPYDLWGLLALACPNVEEVKKLTCDHGISHGCHCTVADEHGGIIGVEAGKGGYAFAEPKEGIYVHANHCITGKPLADHEENPVYGWNSSHHRQKRLRELLEQSSGYLTSQLIYAAMMDHENYPDGICSDERGDHNLTSAAVIVEPRKKRMHVVRGLPSQNWPATYDLE